VIFADLGEFIVLFCLCFIFLGINTLSYSPKHFYFFPCASEFLFTTRTLEIQNLNSQSFPFDSLIATAGGGRMPVIFVVNTVEPLVVFGLVCGHAHDIKGMRVTPHHMSGTIGPKTRQ